MILQKRLSVRIVAFFTSFPNSLHLFEIEDEADHVGVAAIDTFGELQ